LISGIKRGILSENIGEQVAEENIWTEKKLTGSWRKLYNEEVHNLQYSPIRMVR
jgi:hypothetical protein